MAVFIKLLIFLIVFAAFYGWYAEFLSFDSALWTMAYGGFAGLVSAAVSDSLV